MYKIIFNPDLNKNTGIVRLVDNAFIPFAPDNTDYQTFKKEINEGTAQLQDAEGNLMTDAKDFVATLP